MTDPPRPPFIYIASLLRTGSTLLSEALTRLPYAFIFREPHLGKNYFAVKPDDVEALGRLGVDVQAFLRVRLPLAFLQRRLRWLGLPQDGMVRAFKRQILPRLTRQISQVGVKEIRHQGWRNYVRHFPDMKAVITGRDPRDIYLSLASKRARGSLNWRGGFTPETVAERLMDQFRRQQEIASAVDSLLVPYETVCTHPEALDEIHDFVDSPISGTGPIGQFNAQHPDRRDEYALHGDRITAQRVWRWTRESDPQSLQDAWEVFERMKDYRDFWGYTTDASLRPLGARGVVA